MPIASSLTHESRFMALFVGPKHSGKTVAACSWMSEDLKKMTKVHDFDGRIRGLLGAPWINKDRIVYDYFPPRVGDNSKIFFDRVNGDLDALSLEINNRRSPYETFIGDSITAFCNNLISDSLALTHTDGKGKKFGSTNVTGPDDYNFESLNARSYIQYLRSLPINIIVTAHVVDKFDKPFVVDAKGREYKDVYAESVKVGEKLALRDKISANIQIYFDHIFRFDRRIVQGEEHFYVEYISDIACTSFPNLKPGSYDITGKNFRDFTLKLIGNGISSNNLVEVGTKKD